MTSKDVYIGDYTLQHVTQPGLLQQRYHTNAHHAAQPRSCLKPASAENKQPESTAIIRTQPAELSEAALQRAGHSTTMLRSGSVSAAFDVQLEGERKSNGFLVDYVIHVQEQVGGPHAIEVKLSNAKLHWPFLVNLQLVTDIADVFSHFAKQDFAHLQPPNTTASRWMFVNVVLEHGQLLAAGEQQLALQPGSTDSEPWQPAALLHWDVLRVGYDWGADSELVLLVTMQRLAVSLVKTFNLSLIKRSWDHQAGMNVLSPELLSPMSGRVCWHASKPPGCHAWSASGHQASATGSVVSSHQSFASCTTPSASADPVGLSTAAWSTEHQHSITVDIDGIKPQLVIANRWHIHALLRKLLPGKAAHPKLAQAQAVRQSQNSARDVESITAAPDTCSVCESDLEDLPDASHALPCFASPEAGQLHIAMQLPVPKKHRRSISADGASAARRSAHRHGHQHTRRTHRTSAPRPPSYYIPQPVVNLTLQAAANAQPMCGTSH